MAAKITFGERLKQLRGEKGLTQQDLADIIGVAKNTVSIYERNARMPDMDILEQLGDLFEVNLGYLLGQNIPREKPTEPDNETLSRWVTEEEVEDIMRMYLKMSPKSQALAMEAVKAMYKADREWTDKSGNNA